VTLLPALAVSSDEVVLALQHAGFAARRDGHTMILDRGMRTVVVPSVALLSAEQLSSTLRAAGVAYTEFLERLSDLAIGTAAVSLREA
jgi:hypothetical protein